MEVMGTVFLDEYNQSIAKSTILKIMASFMQVLYKAIY